MTITHGISHYWPALYPLADDRGCIRYKRSGDGRHGTIERAIQQLQLEVGVEVTGKLLEFELHVAPPIGSTSRQMRLPRIPTERIP